MSDNPFRGALSVLEEHGWAAHQMVDPKGCVCLLGAIAVDVKGYDWLLRSPSVRVYDMLEAEAPARLLVVLEAALKEYSYPGAISDSDTPIDMAVNYNDIQAIAVEEVEALLLNAAERWDASA